jgi:hypothetical protein
MLSASSLSIYILVLTIDIYVVKQEDSSTSQILLDHMQKKNEAKKKTQANIHNIRTWIWKGFCCVTS